MKDLDIREIITRKENGVYRVALEDCERLEEILKEVKEDGSLNASNMTYSKLQEDNYISIAFYKVIKF